MAKRTGLLLLFFFILHCAYATTWDEPWAEKVIKEADAFVLAKVKSSDEEKGVSIEVLKTLGGQLPGKIKITDFYLLDLCSSSGGHGPEFHFRKAKPYYFFIKKNAKGKYCIATPTTGFALVENDTVRATYRHSYHQALVPAVTYEKTMTAIFNKHHNLPFDANFVQAYVAKSLSLKPAGFNKAEINTFFAQHVALESIYHLQLPGFYNHILPFLQDTANFHNQISAARALTAYNTSGSREALLQVISDSSRATFVQAVCVSTLATWKPIELKEQLIKIKETASGKGNGFGGNIMDPRVCSSLPSVKKSLEQLISEL